VAALEEIGKVMPFPLLGWTRTTVASSSTITCWSWCEQRKLTFTRSRPGNSNDGAHVEHKTALLTHLWVPGRV
jgi:hypothetical protein